LISRLSLQKVLGRGRRKTKGGGKKHLDGITRRTTSPTKIGEHGHKEEGLGVSMEDRTRNRTKKDRGVRKKKKGKTTLSLEEISLNGQHPVTSHC